jgi:multiple sugar transport system substrate-binding protein
MRLKATLSRMALGLSAAAMIAATAPAHAADLSMWVRESASDPGQLMVDLWNSTHDTKIELTAIPDNQMVTKLATSVRAGDAPDLISFDLIYMPDFMRAGFLVDVTDQVQADPNYASMAEAYKDIATYEDRIYGVGFTPDVSILVWNKELFRQAGLDPEQPPRTIYEIQEMARKIGAIGDDVYGFYFAGSCPGCNIFVTSPLMVAGGAKILPRSGDDTALEGDAIREVLRVYKEMWEEGLIPESAEVDTGAQFVTGFTSGNVGIAGSGGFLISLTEREYPDLDYGVALLPGLEPGQVSGFVGGDVVAIPAGTP